MRQILIAAFGLALAAPVARAQSVCLPNDYWGRILVSYMRRFSVTPVGGNAMVRFSLGLPYITDSTTVTLVTSEQICKEARDAYIANAPAGATPSAGRVYVVTHRRQVRGGRSGLPLLERRRMDDPDSELEVHFSEILFVALPVETPRLTRGAFLVTAR